MIPLPEVQKKGLVSVYYDVAKPGEQIPMPRLSFMMTILNFTASLPMRYSAMHICLKTGIGNAAVNNAILGFSLKKFSQYSRARTLMHYGSDIELQYSLRSHGFPAGTFPVDADGNFREDIVNAWFYKHQNKELESKLLTQVNGLCATGEDVDSRSCSSMQLWSDEQGGNGHAKAQDADESDDINGNATVALHNNNTPGPNQEAFIEPTDNDVLFGRGKRIQYHPGNVAFRGFLANYSDSYDNSRRKDRPQLCSHLVMVLRAKGVRFCEETSPGVWIQSDAKEAEKKIGQLFRTIRKQKK